MAAGCSSVLPASGGLFLEGAGGEKSGLTWGKKRKFLIQKDKRRTGEVGRALA